MQVSRVNRTFDSGSGTGICAWGTAASASLTTTVHFFGDGGFLNRTENISGTSVDLRLRGTDRLAVIVWPLTERETRG